jgi:glucan 1,3-beta-glucosidase
VLKVQLRPRWLFVRSAKDSTGDGVTDDTVAINNAISAGSRCGEGCDSSTTTPAIVYFPPGTYMVSSPIIQYYYTQFIGDANSIPTIKATATFQGIAVIDSDPYIPNGNGANWYTNQNNFFRQIRNFVIDLTSLPMNTGAGVCSSCWATCQNDTLRSMQIHWQVAQATSLQNIQFNMVVGGGTTNKQQGIFMDNGSGKVPGVPPTPASVLTLHRRFHDRLGLQRWQLWCISR